MHPQIQSVSLMVLQGHHAGVNTVKEVSCGESAVGSPLSGLMVHLFKNFYARSVTCGPIVNTAIQITKGLKD